MPRLRRSAACADRRTARRHRLRLRPTFAPPVRRRRWQARARGPGTAAVLTAVPPRAALHRCLYQEEDLRRQHRRQHRRQRLSAEIAACSWAVRLSSAKPLTIRIREFQAAPAISIPMSGEYHVLRATPVIGWHLGLRLAMA